MRDDVRRPNRAPVVVWAVLILLAAAVAWWRAPATPVPAGAPAGVFSAERAAQAAAPVLAEPRPTGSPANAAARQDLVAQLTAQGWQVRVDAGVGAFQPSRNLADQPAIGGHVHNVVATLPGTDPTGTVVLACHYDSVPGSPGGGDDGIGVATMLETGRILAGQGAHRNDIVLLFTDGEENGMLGAHAYVHGPGRALTGPVTVVNHEARGASGIPVVFRSNGDVRPLLARMPLPEAESFATVLFQFLPHDTDFSRWQEAGWTGIDTAITGDGSVYHTPLDTLDRLDTGSLQSQGELTLAVSRYLAGADLTGTAATAGEPTPPLTSMPWGVLALPALSVQLLAAAEVGLTGVAVWRARRAAALSLRGVAAAAGAVLVALVVIAAGAAALWPLAARIEPTTPSVAVGEPSVSWPFLVAELSVVVAGVVTLLAVTRRRPGRPALAHGAVLVLGLLTLTGALLLPALVVVLVVPLLGAAAALLVAGPQTWRVVAVTVLLTPAGWLWGSQLDAAFDLGAAGSLGMVGILGALGAVAGFAALACGPRAGRTGVTSRSRWRPVAAVAACWLLPVVAVAAGLAVNRSHPDPRQEYLAYQVRDGQGAWSGTMRSPWARALPGGPAPALSAPQAQVVNEHVTAQGRTVDLLVSSSRGAHDLTVEVDQPHRLTAVALEDVPLPVAAGTGEVVVAGAPATGTRVRLQLAGQGPVQVTVTDVTHDLAHAPGWTPPPAGWVVVQPRFTLSAVQQV